MYTLVRGLPQVQPGRRPLTPQAVLDLPFGNWPAGFSGQYAGQPVAPVPGGERVAGRLEPPTRSG